MDDRAAVMGHGRTMVPNLYTIELSGTDFERLSRLRGGPLRRARRRRAGARRLAALPARRPGPDQLPPRRRARDRRVPGPARDVSRRSIAPSTQAPAPRDGARRRRTRPVAAPPQRPTASPVARPWLVIDGERYPLIGAHTVIGRDELADVVLDDPGISRRHCEIRVTNDGPHLVTSIRDLGSTNGTFVNGERITSTRLDEGDEITIGRTHAVFRPGKR